MSTSNPAGRRYHHGNLRAALIEAGVELAREGGPDAIVLREACRRVGVSHNAAYRHFPDRVALLAEVATEAMASLARLMEQMIDEVAEADPESRGPLVLLATGRAYVRFALSEPGLFRTAFSVADHTEGTGADEVDEHGRPGPFGLLQRGLDELVAAGGLAPDRRPGAEYTAWAGVHGISMLLLDGPLRDLPEPEREPVIERVLADLGRGITGVDPPDAADAAGSLRPSDPPELHCAD